MNLKERFWEVDFLRGLAVILMIAYHFIFDLSFFGIFPLFKLHPGGTIRYLFQWKRFLFQIPEKRALDILLGTGDYPGHLDIHQGRIHSLRHPALHRTGHNPSISFLKIQ